MCVCVYIIFSVYILFQIVPCACHFRCHQPTVDVNSTFKTSILTLKKIQVCTYVCMQCPGYIHKIHKDKYALPCLC